MTTVHPPVAARPTLSHDLDRSLVKVESDKGRLRLRFLAAQAASRSHSALGAFYRRLRSRLGAPKAITATAHKLAKIIYNMLRHGAEYVEAGQKYYEEQYRDRVIKNLQRKAAEFGLSLVEMPLELQNKNSITSI